MESSRTRIAGPAIAAGAVSVGLVLVGVFGLEPEDTYVAPPPLKSDSNQAAPARDEDSTATTTARITIPPSPSWQVAPAGAPRRPAGYTTVADTDPSSTDDPSATATTTRAGTSTSEEATSTTRTRTLTLEPTTTVPDTGAAEETDEDPATE